jgi:diacylglycerol kinase family enzyme
VRVLLVVNAAASSVTARRRVLVRKVLAADHDVAVVETTHRGHATELAADAVADGLDCVVVLGGDGTLNEVADALVGARTALAALPGGSTNVLARTIGLPDDAVLAADALGRALAAGSVERIGIGLVDGRAFLLHTGIGWDAALVAEVERHGRLKRYANHSLFVAAGLRTFLGGYDRRRPHLRVVFDDGTTVEDGFFTLVLNSDPYTFVGRRPFRVAPAADLHHPFAVVTLRTLALPRFLVMMAGALRGDGLRPGRWLDVRTGVRSLRVERRTTMPYQVDGDHLGQADVLELVHRPDAVRLVVPLPEDRVDRVDRVRGG